MKKLYCPVCGAKVKDGVCPYCLITESQIINASNIEAKKAIKEGRSKEVHNSTYMPSDVNKRNLMWITILLGYSGASALYLGRRVKGWYQISVFISWFLTDTLREIFSNISVGIAIGFGFLANIFVYLVVFNLIIWMFDITAYFTNKTKVPVVLGKKDVVDVKKTVNHYKKRNKK